MARRGGRPAPKRARRSIPAAPMPTVEQSRSTPFDDVLIGGGRQPGARPYDDVLLGGRPAATGYDPPRRQYRRQYPHLFPGADRYLVSPKPDHLRREIKRWRATGDDQRLVPHGTYPAQTSNTQRPRTLAIGYEPESRELRVKFRDGAVYVYYDVPPDVYEEMLSADSIGHYMNDHVVHSYYYDQESYNRRNT